MTEHNYFGEELTGDSLLIVQAARIIAKGITTRSDSDALSVLKRRLAEAHAAWAKCEQLDQQACDAEARAERAESKLAAIRKLVTYDKPLSGESADVPRFIVKGCEVLAVLEEP